VKYSLVQQSDLIDVPGTSFFFNTPSFLQTISGKRISLYLKNIKTNQVAGEVHFFQEGVCAYSPLKGSFGSFHFSEKLKAADVVFFVTETERFLKKEGVEKVFLRGCPYAYAPYAAQLLTAVLLAEKYSLLYTDLNYHLDLSLDISSNLRESEPERIKAAIKAGMVFSRWEDPDLEKVYAILKVCRDQKNYPLTLSLDAFAAMFATFPTVYSVFKIEYHREIIAVAVTIHINTDILYNFYVGELPAYRKMSPTALLIKEMAEFARQSGYKLFDLGIGSDKGILNPGLVNFKENMGGIPSLKPAFEKLL